VLAFVWPQITAFALVLLIGAWALVTGGLELGGAIRLRHHMAHPVLLAIGGVVSILFGLLVVLLPGAGALAVVTALGIYGLVFGSLLLGLGLSIKVRSLQTQSTSPA
jgi:uncharacterized membrane protein HdeD (DUF308 family)